MRYKGSYGDEFFTKQRKHAARRWAERVSFVRQNGYDVMPGDNVFADMVKWYRREWMWAAGLI